MFNFWWGFAIGVSLIIPWVLYYRVKNDMLEKAQDILISCQNDLIKDQNDLIRDYRLKFISEDKSDV